MLDIVSPLDLTGNKRPFGRLVQFGVPLDTLTQGLLGLVLLTHEFPFLALLLSDLVELEIVPKYPLNLFAGQDVFFGGDVIWTR
jgi:hypothetical protein